jgi:hypothetical protein
MELLAFALVFFEVARNTGFVGPSTLILLDKLGGGIVGLKKQQQRYRRISKYVDTITITNSAPMIAAKIKNLGVISSRAKHTTINKSKKKAKIRVHKTGQLTVSSSIMPNSSSIGR